MFSCNGEERGASICHLRCVPTRPRVVDKNSMPSAKKKRVDWASNYREIFDAANDGIFVHDCRTGQILDANRKASRMYGYEVADFRRTSIGELSSGEPPYTQLKAVQYVKRAAQGKAVLVEWQAKNRQGKCFWVEVSLKRVRLSGRDCILAVIRDISRRKRIQAEIAQAQKTQLEVIADMNHHIRNALETIGFSAHATHNKELISNINFASERIQWALREVLPKTAAQPQLQSKTRPAPRRVTPLLRTAIER